MKSKSVIFLLLVLCVITVTAFERRDNVKVDDDCNTTTTTTRTHTHRATATITTTTTTRKTHGPTTTSTGTISVTRTSTDTPTNIPFVQNGTCINCVNDICKYVCHDKSCNGYCKDGPCEMICYMVPALQSTKYKPEILIMAILLMTLGVYLMVMGFPYFIITMAISGLLIGSTVTWTILNATEPAEQGYSNRSILYWSALAGGGLLLAAASLYFYTITMYLLVGTTGYLVSVFVWAWKDNFILEDILVRNIVGLALAFTFMLALVFIEHATVIISTSFMGAFVFICGLEFLLNTGLLVGIRTLFDFEKSKDVKTGVKFLSEYKVNTHVIGMLSGVIGLWLIATVWQRIFNRGKRFGVHLDLNSNDTLKDQHEAGLVKKSKK